MSDLAAAIFTKARDPRDGDGDGWIDEGKPTKRRAIPLVPAARRIRRSKVRNIDTDRLQRRQAHIVSVAEGGFQDVGQRRQMVDLAQELFAIENELDARGVSYDRRSLPREVSDAMSTPEPPADSFEVYVTEPIADFADHVGQPWHHDTWGEVRIDPDEQMQIAAAYDALPDWDDDARPAYDALISELNDQYQLLTETLGYKVEVVDEDPYPDVKALLADVHDNKRIKVLSTKSTPPGHPYLTDAENDKFRAVHDAFGHAGTGRGFDRHGEEAAYQAHANMFGPLARLALATETRGQNAMLIRSVIETGEAEFAPQKFAVMDDIFTKAYGGDPSSPEDAVVSGAGHVRHYSLGRCLLHMDPADVEAWTSRRESARAEETKDFDPAQARIPAGKPGGGRWLKKVVASAFQLDSDSVHEGSAAQKLWGASLDDAFPGGGLTRPAPWPNMARRKDRQDYDTEIVKQALLNPPELTTIDPRDLRSTQPSVTRPGVDYYLNDPTYHRRGKTYEGGNNAGNRYPFVYVREDGQRLLLAGHHRAMAALLDQAPLEAIVVHGPWGPPRKGR